MRSVSFISSTSGPNSWVGISRARKKRYTYLDGDIYPRPFAQGIGRDGLIARLHFGCEDKWFVEGSHLTPGVECAAPDRAGALVKDDALVGWSGYRRERHLYCPFPAAPGPGGDTLHRCRGDVLVGPLRLLTQAEAEECLGQVSCEAPICQPWVTGSPRRGHIGPRSYRSGRCGPRIVRLRPPAGRSSLA